MTVETERLMGVSMSAGSCHLLFVDDSYDDHFFFQNAVRQLLPGVRLLQPLHDGVEALAYLCGDGHFADRHSYPFPDLMVLDLRMPIKNGHEVLAWLRSHPSPPVTVVFSASDLQRDIVRASALGARHYFVKPCDWTEWRKAVKAIAQYCPRRAVSE